MPDISVSAEQLKAAAEWVEAGDRMAIVELRTDCGELVVGQGNAFARIDGDGKVLEAVDH